jgi:hypothetical protein
MGLPNWAIPVFQLPTPLFWPMRCIATYRADSESYARVYQSKTCEFTYILASKLSPHPPCLTVVPAVSQI